MFKKIYTAACAALLLACCQIAAAATISVAATPATPVAPASISLSVTLTDNPEAVAITQVEYFNGASSLGVSGSAPFQLDLTGMAAGSYTIVARATVDSAGNPVLVSAPLPLTISVATTTPGVYFVHTDQLNTPRVITNGAGALVWQWDSDPFGATAPAEQPAGQAPFVNNLRFAGQYYDKETNLVHNGYRDYDPQTGRYVESDPIGLAGGINTYAYVLGNPISYSDPLGLLVTGTYDRSTGTLTLRDIDKGTTFAGHFESGGKPWGDPIPAGQYDVLARAGRDGFYRLEPVDSNYGDDTDEQTGRTHFRLHHPGRTLGCIAAKDEKSWHDAEDFINSTRTDNVSVTSMSRNPWGPKTETLPRYGRINVVN